MIKKIYTFLVLSAIPGDINQLSYYSLSSHQSHIDFVMFCHENPILSCVMISLMRRYDDHLAPNRILDRP